jgi:hypothetical protein
MKTPQATAYIRQRRLCVVGVEETDLGPVPFAVSVPVEWAEEGPVDFGTEIPEPIAVALDGAQATIDSTIDEGRQKLAVENLVLRARQWDQNALAMLHGIREGATRGDPRAKQSFAYARAFIKRHPPKKTVVFGGESVPTIAPSAMIRILEEQDNALGRVLCGRLFHNYLSPYTLARVFADSQELEEIRRCVLRGRFEDKDVRIMMGAAKEARLLERARRGDLRAWCGPVAAWELGFPES